MYDDLIGTRFKALRKKRRLSQDQTARLFGFNDRQTISAIETGVRRMTASELLVAVEKLNAPLGYFTDPFRLDGEARFAWRRTRTDETEIHQLETTAGSWIGAYRALSKRTGRPLPFMRHSLSLTKSAKLEEAEFAGERFVKAFELGSVPAQNLLTVMEQRLSILVLMIDCQSGISGAACRIPEFDVVLISRREVEGRRNFDLAHELFHILTWETMPPQHIENDTAPRVNKIEQLANNFAAAVLMPKDALETSEFWGKLDNADLIRQLNFRANQLHVTSSALRWRLVRLGILPKAKAIEIPESALQNNDRKRQTALPPLYSRSFVEVICKAMDSGLLSARRTASLLGLSFDELEELFKSYQIDYEIDL